MVAKYPLLGIAMPLYNGESYVAKTIEAVLSQRYGDFHFHIFNDCSQDNSLEIAKEFEKKDSRIFVHENPINLGQTGNFNRCFRLTGYEYVAVKSQDDMILDDYYLKCIDFLAQNPDYVACYTNDIKCKNSLYQYINDDPYARAEDVLRHLCCGNLNYGVYRSQTIYQTLPWQYIPGNDNVFHFNIALLGKIKKIDDKLYCRLWPKRSAEEYFRICSTGFKTSPTIVVTRFRLLEMFLGFIYVCNYGYLGGIERDRLILIVVNTMLNLCASQLLKELGEWRCLLSSDKDLDIYSRQILYQRYMTIKFYLVDYGLRNKFKYKLLNTRRKNAD